MERMDNQRTTRYEVLVYLYDAVGCGSRLRLLAAAMHACHAFWVCIIGISHLHHAMPSQAHL